MSEKTATIPNGDTLHSLFALFGMGDDVELDMTPDCANWNITVTGPNEYLVELANIPYDMDCGVFLDMLAEALEGFDASRAYRERVELNGDEDEDMQDAVVDEIYFRTRAKDVRTMHATAVDLCALYGQDEVRVPDLWYATIGDPRLELVGILLGEAVKGLEH